MLGYLSRVWKLRYFWWALVRIDLRKRYRGSAIGMGWSLLQPIAMTVVLCTVFGQIFHADVRTYAPYLLSGLTVWSFITAVMTQGCQCFFNSEAYIRQHPAPLAIYPLRVTLGASVHLVLGLLVLLGLGVVYPRLQQSSRLDRPGAGPGAFAGVWMVVGDLHGSGQRALSGYDALDRDPCCKSSFI